MEYTRQLADQVNCTATTDSRTGRRPRNGGAGVEGTAGVMAETSAVESASLLQCFKAAPWELLVRADVIAPKYYSAFGPTVDGRSILPATVQQMMLRTSLEQNTGMCGVGKYCRTKHWYVWSG